MKTETLLVLGAVLFLFWKSKQPAQPPGGTGQGGTGTGGNTPGGITWVACGDPGADPTMCAIIQNNY